MSWTSNISNFLNRIADTVSRYTQQVLISFYSRTQQNAKDNSKVFEITGEKKQ